MLRVKTEPMALSAAPVDLVIDARWIVPVEPSGVVFDHHSLAVNRGRIVGLVSRHEVEDRFTPRERRRLDHHVLIPGLVNLHTHAAMTLLRGIADDLPLMAWLQDYVWPAEAQHVCEQFVYDGTRLACAEMLRGGVTCFNDMYFFPQAAANAAIASGMRAAIGLIAVDFPSNYAADVDDYLAKGLAVRDQLLDEPLLSFCLAPHAPYTVSERGFARVLTLAEQVGLPIHLHLHETKQEIEDSERQFGVRPIERLRRLGLLTPDLIAVHAVHLNEHEMDLLAQQGCSVAHCPSSNLKLASGIAPITPLLERGVNIGLGTDGAASNNRLDIFQEMRLAALLAKEQGGRADAIDAHRVLHMATLGGAQALGLDAEIGSLTVGKQADLCAVNLDDIALAPCYHPASHLTYSIGREHVSDVWVGGRLRVENGQLMANNEAGLISMARLWQNKISP